MPNLIYQILESTRFLSRLPVHKVMSDGAAIDFSKCAHAFPISGLLIALPATLVLLVCHTLLPPLVLAIVVVMLVVLTTGGLHEDGLADVADGFWGGFDRARKLEIMRDSHVGTYGVLALVFCLSLRIALLASVLGSLTLISATLLFLAFESLSRAAILVPWALLPNAREDSGGQTSLADRYGRPNKAALVKSSLLCLPAFFLTARSAFETGSVLLFVLPPIAGFLLVLLMMRLASQHIQGQTGDVLGATQQLALLGLYLGAVMAI